MVYHGPLGESCDTLVSYFESKGAPMIEIGDNAANWMLRVITDDSLGDLAAAYRDSEEYDALIEELDRIKDDPKADEQIKYDSEFAVSAGRRHELVNRRLRTIYWRSPTYSLAKISVSAMIAFILGSVFILDRNEDTYTEIQMRSRLSTIFLSFIIVGILGIISVVRTLMLARSTCLCIVGHHHCR